MLLIESCFATIGGKLVFSKFIEVLLFFAMLIGSSFSLLKLDLSGLVLIAVISVAASLFLILFI